MWYPPLFGRFQLAKNLGCSRVRIKRSNERYEARMNDNWSRGNGMSSEVASSEKWQFGKTRENEILKENHFEELNKDFIY